MIRHKNNSGFTLTELLVYMGIFSIILVIITQMFVSILQSQLDTQSTSSVEQDSRFLIQRFIYDVQRASAITNPSSGQSSSLTLTINGQPYTYQVVNNNLLINSTIKLNSHDTNIQNLIFSRSGNTVSIGGTVISQIIKSSGSEVRNIITTTNLRPN